MTLRDNPLCFVAKSTSFWPILEKYAVPHPSTSGVCDTAVFVEKTVSRQRILPCLLVSDWTQSSFPEFSAASAGVT